MENRYRMEMLRIDNKLILIANQLIATHAVDHNSQQMYNVSMRLTFRSFPTDFALLWSGEMQTTAEVMADGDGDRPCH